ncbi:MAG: hypothetical protein QW478_10225 [Candidatus Micrarchaeaceae archaeon]
MGNSKEKIVTINGKKYVQKIWDKDCDEPFRYLEEVVNRAKRKERK